MIPKVAKLGTGFVGAGLYYLHDKREEGRSKSGTSRPSAAEYFLSDKGPQQSSDRVGFTATRNLPTDDPMTALRHMAFTATHAEDIRVAAVAASAKAAGLSYDDYVKKTNPFRGRKGQKPVYSLSLAFEPGDPQATRENMLKAADEVRHFLGFEKLQCLLVEHTDTKHPHVHLIFNRVDPQTGRFAKIGNDRLKLSKWALDWEKRHGPVLCQQREENWKRRDRNTDQKIKARAKGDRRAKAGYIKNKGLPPSEIDFWNKHGSHDLKAVRAARLERQKYDYESYKRRTESRLKGVDQHHERANGSTLRRIDRTLATLRGGQAIRHHLKGHRGLGRAFAAVQGSVNALAGCLKHRSDIAKLLKLRRSIEREREERRKTVLKERKAAFEKMKRIHAWQNWLDEKRCKTYRDSDTRDYRDRMARYDIAKAKAPVFGSVHVSLYDVEQSRHWKKAQEDIRALGEAAEFRRIDDQQSSVPKESLSYIPRDETAHAKAIAEDVRRDRLMRKQRTRGRSTGRKRRPRPRKLE